MRKYLLSIQFALLEFLAIFPFLLWLNSMLLDHLFQFSNWIYFPITYVTIVTIGHLTSRVSLRALSVIAISIGIAYLLPTYTSLQRIVVFFLFLIITSHAFQYNREDPEEVYPLSMIWAVSLPSYVVSYILYRGGGSVDYQQLLSIFGFILVFLLLFWTNKAHLKKATLEKSQQKKLNMKTKRQNYLYVIFVFILLLLLTRFNFIGGFFFMALRAVFRFIGLSSRGINIGGGDSEVAPNFGINPGATQGGGTIDFLFRFIGFIILIGVIVLIVYQIIKRIPFLAKLLRTLLKNPLDYLLRLRRKRDQEEDDGYDDETESVFNINERFDQMIDNMKLRFNREKKWTDLSDQEKARRLYRYVIKHSVKNGFPYDSSETAAESIDRLDKELINNKALTTWLAETYDKARYSSLTIEQIDELRADLEQNGWIG